jgi:hypothetical protein
LKQKSKMFLPVITIENVGQVIITNNPKINLDEGVIMCISVFLKRKNITHLVIEVFS